MAGRAGFLSSWRLLMFRPRWLTVSVLVGAVGCAATCSGAAAAPQPIDPPISVVPADPGGRSGAPSVGLEVRDAGRYGGPKAPGAVSGVGARGGDSACRWVLAPEVEQWIRRLPSRLSAGAGPGRVAETGGSGQDTIEPASRLYQQVCNGLAGGYQWFGPGQPGAAAAALPSPAELAREAYAQLRLPVPTPGHSPDLRLADGRVAVLIGEHTWVWTDRSRFRSLSRRLQVGPVWAAVTAIPVGLSFDPGNGNPTMSCAGPGTPFVPGRYPVHAASSTCDYVYSRSSSGQPGGVVSAEYRIRWRVRWTGSTGSVAAGGRLPDMTSRTMTTLAVAEAQALGTRGVQG